LVVHQHRAGPALALSTPQLGAGQGKVVADNAEQASGARTSQAAFDPVYVDDEGLIKFPHDFLAFGMVSSWLQCGFPARLTRGTGEAEPRGELGE
jgi:hypothetical protein